MSSSNDPKRMKSRLLAAVSDDPESEGAKKLSRHLRDLITGLDDSTREICVAKLGEARKVRTEREREALMASIISDDPAERVKVEHSLSVLSFLVDALLSDSIPAGDHQLWGGDLEHLGWLDQGSRPVFDALLKKLISECLPALRTQHRRLRTEAGVLPNFKSLGMTVEARAVNKDRYRWGMPLVGDGAYRPEIIGTAIIASVHVGVDEGYPEDFYFQMDETDIDNFMSSLRAAKLEIAALRSYLNLDAEGMVKKDD